MAKTKPSKKKGPVPLSRTMPGELARRSANKENLKALRQRTLRTKAK